MTDQDINDLLQASGLYAVGGSQDLPGIEKALAKLSIAAEQLGPVGRVLIADAAVKHLKTVGLDRAAKVVDAGFKRSPKASHPSPQMAATYVASETVEGGALIRDIVACVERFAWLPSFGALKIALFALYCHVFAQFEVSPILAITSAGPGAGKTRVLDILELLVPKAWRVSASTTASLFRQIEAEHPTVLFDEFDNVDPGSRKDLIAMLNGGHTKSGSNISLCVGDSNEPTKFNVFAPKVFAGNTRFFPETTWSRSIVIEMEPKPKSAKIERFLRSEMETEFADLFARMARWSLDNTQALRTAHPTIPTNLGDRVADNWMSLFVIADLLGEPWGTLARRAASESTDGGYAEESEGRQLLSNIRTIFTEKGVDRMPTTVLLAALCSNEEWPWGDQGKGGMSPHDLAKRLRPYRVKPKALNLKNGNYAKGYYLKDLQRAFAIHLQHETAAEDHDVGHGPPEDGGDDDVTVITVTPPPSPSPPPNAPDANGSSQ